VNRQLLFFTIAFGTLFLVGLIWFVYEVASSPRTEPPPGPAFLFDRDLDGLDDAKEEELGTSPIESDTDHDGLDDNQEINTYQTDPQSPDSDGDTFLDGVEVVGGYDPLGPGRLPSL
jgi:hypothetical protein